MQEVHSGTGFRYPVPEGGDARMHHGSIYPLLVPTAKAEATRARPA